MRSKGFTLIELLAVIVILAIIALIATPIILGIINDARKESQERSVELYATAVKNGIALSQLSTGKAVKAGTYTSSTLPFEVEYDGDVECATIEIYEDGTIYVEGCTVNQETVDYAYGKNKVTDKACTLEDKDGDGVASLSDVVTCGTESFYVMSNENNEITMLSMYNLYVGVFEDDTTGDKMQISNPTNKQDELAKGWVDGDSIWYGYVAFSNTNYWDSNVNEYPYFVYDSRADIIYSYVNEYERILKEDLKVNSAEASLISFEQLKELGCDLSRESCGPDIGYGELEKPAPSWVYSTSYWTGSAYDYNDILFVDSFGYFSVGVTLGGGNHKSVGSIGVRPVVTISVSEIE